MTSFFRGCGWEPRFVEGDEPDEDAPGRWPPRWTGPSGRSSASSANARQTGDASRPRWPMIVLRTPKGWTGPKEVDGQTIEGSCRAHQVPISMGPDTDTHLPALGVLAALL